MHARSKCRPNFVKRHRLQREHSPHDTRARKCFNRLKNLIIKTSSLTASTEALARTNRAEVRQLPQSFVKTSLKTSSFQRAQSARCPGVELRELPQTSSKRHQTNNFIVQRAQCIICIITPAGFATRGCRVAASNRSTTVRYAMKRVATLIPHLQ